MTIQERRNQVIKIAGERQACRRYVVIPNDAPAYQLPDTKTMQDIMAAVQRKTGANPTQDEVAAALEATLLERLHDIQTLAAVLKDNNETYVRFLAAKLS